MRNVYPKSVCIFIAHSTFRTLRSHLTPTTRLGYFWPSSGRFHNYIHGNAYRGGGGLFTVNILKYVYFEYYGLLGNNEIYTIVGKKI
jgi:hypothetical protein